MQQKASYVPCGTYSSLHYTTAHNVKQVGTVGYKKNIDSFTVVAQSVRFHETRAMMDGQIHDIQKVSETIAQVRRDAPLYSRHNKNLYFHPGFPSG